MQIELRHRKEKETRLNSRDSAVSIFHADFKFSKYLWCFQNTRGDMKNAMKFNQISSKVQRGEWALGKCTHCTQLNVSKPGVSDIWNYLAPVQHNPHPSPATPPPFSASRWISRTRAEISLVSHKVMQVSHSPVLGKLGHFTSGATRPCNISEVPRTVGISLLTQLFLSNKVSSQWSPSHLAHSHGSPFATLSPTLRAWVV